MGLRLPLPGKVVRVVLDVVGDERFGPEAVCGRGDSPSRNKLTSANTDTAMRVRLSKPDTF